MSLAANLHLAKIKSLLENTHLRDTFITATDSKAPLTMEGIASRVEASVISTFDERTRSGGALLQTWIFLRNQNKFVINKGERNYSKKAKPRVKIIRR